MKTIIYIICCLCVCWYSCGLKNSTSNLIRKDTIVNYNYDISLFGGQILQDPIVERLDNYLYVEINFQSNSYLYDTLNDSILTIPTSDCPSLCYSFVENFINTYYNHFPLSHYDLKVIKRMIVYSCFIVPPYQEESYAERKLKSKLFSIVDTKMVKDTLNQLYFFTLRDTVYEIEADIELRYCENTYHIYIDK